jgi:hypothetical protein
VQSAATLDMPGGDHRPVHAAIEAVIAFDDSGGYAIRDWREMRGADARAAGNEAQVESAAGTGNGTN